MRVRPEKGGVCGRRGGAGGILGRWGVARRGVWEGGGVEGNQLTGITAG